MLLRKLTFGLHAFYNEERHWEVFRNIKNRGSKSPSIRTIEFTLTTYAERHDIRYIVARKDDALPTFAELHDLDRQNALVQAGYTLNLFVLHQAYKDQVCTEQKRWFDPCARGKRITYKTVETTLGQLNFYRWAITFALIPWIQANVVRISAEMSTEQKQKSLCRALAKRPDQYRPRKETLRRKTRATKPSLPTIVHCARTTLLTPAEPNGDAKKEDTNQYIEPSVVV